MGNSILFTGASSFTGYWFVRALHAAGHRVVAPLRGSLAHYAAAGGMRAERVRLLAEYAEIVEHCTFGSPEFLALCASRPFELLCHHAARVGDYKSPDFDVQEAVAANTLNLAQALTALKNGGLRGMLLTGSVFEAGEGTGTLPLVAFSPYGLSKTLTAEIAAFQCHQAGVRFGKFVIPNVFGPLQEPRFYDFVLRQWQHGETATITTPDYVRDHIPVDAMALAYAHYAQALIAGDAAANCNPSLYAEPMDKFTERLANEVRSRTGLPCDYACIRQTAFTEPLVRINTDPIATLAPEWDESAAWNALVAAYYR